MSRSIVDATYSDPKNGAMPLVEAFAKGLITFQKDDEIKKLLSDAAELLKEIAEYQSVTLGDVATIFEWIRRYEELK